LRPKLLGSILNAEEARGAAVGGAPRADYETEAGAAHLPIAPAYRGQALLRQHFDLICKKLERLSQCWATIRTAG